MFCNRGHEILHIAILTDPKIKYLGRLPVYDDPIILARINGTVQKNPVLQGFVNNKGT